MSEKIKKIEKSVTVVYEYETTDGKKFDFLHNAELHQEILDGKKKVCPVCHGSKGSRERIAQWGDIDGGWGGRPPKDEYKFSKCIRCNGKGYLEMGWN